MPLTFQRVSQNRKTGPIATTYRAGTRSAYGTCPTTCSLCPSATAAARRLDDAYTAAVLAAVPRNGQAFTYSSFPVEDWAPAMLERMAAGLPTTVVNASTTSLAALDALPAGVPGVVALSAEAWDAVSQGGRAGWSPAGRRLVRCPEQTGRARDCASCGDGRPLCARADRGFAVVFVAHGNQSKRVGDDSTPGGCYAAGGRTWLHWRTVADAAEARHAGEADADRVRREVRALPPGSIVRHHVAGDLGAED